MTKHHDKHFGTLQQDPEFGGWSVDLDQIRYTFESLEALPHAHKLLPNLVHWTEQAKHFAANEMLECKNSSWPDEDDDEKEIIINAEEFAERMDLQSISVNTNGALSFWFDDGDLFDGHLILVEYDSEGWRGSSIQG